MDIVRRRIREMREARGLSQKQLARMLNEDEQFSRGEEVYQQTISGWEQGPNLIPHDAIFALSRALEVDPTYFVGDRERNDVLWLEAGRKLNPLCRASLLEFLENLKDNTSTACP